MSAGHRYDATDSDPESPDPKTDADHRLPLPLVEQADIVPGGPQLVPKLMIDAAYAPSPWPLTGPGGEAIDTVLLYVGGDTPNPVTDVAISALPAQYRYRWPCWVRSNPTDAVQAAQDVAAFVSWLTGHHVPQGTAVILDLETAVNAVYVEAFVRGVHAAGYRLDDYGSRSTLYQNPAVDGTFDANPGDAPGTIDPGNDATQDVYAGSYDLSWVKDSVPLWDTQPTSSVPTIPGGSSMLSFLPNASDYRCDLAYLDGGALWHAWGSGMSQLVDGTAGLQNWGSPEGRKIVRIVGWGWDQHGVGLNAVVLCDDQLLYGQWWTLQGVGSGWQPLKAQGSASLASDEAVVPPSPDEPLRKALESAVAGLSPT